MEHYYILILEMYLNESKSIQKNFGLELDFLKDERVKKMLANQGLYNGFLASGLMWSLTESGEFQFQIAIFFLICIICAAIYGSVTVSKKIFLLQGITTCPKATSARNCSTSMRSFSATIFIASVTKPFCAASN